VKLQVEKPCDPMTDDEIEKLCAEATPGGEDGAWLVVNYDGLHILGKGGRIVSEISMPYERGGFTREHTRVEDARFIAAARQLVPDLLARARAAEDARDEWARQCNMASEAHADALNDCAGLAERIRLLEQERTAMAEGLKRMAEERDEALHELEAYAHDDGDCECLTFDGEEELCPHAERERERAMAEVKP
jgi:hypothetical protein